MRRLNGYAAVVKTNVLYHGDNRVRRVFTMRVLMIVAGLMVVAACSGGAGSGPPADYTSHVCAASKAMGGELNDAITELSAVAQTGDIPGMLTAINHVQAATDTIQAALVGTPAWAPGDALVTDMGAVASQYGSAVKKARSALATQDEATLTLALADISAANASVSAAVKDLATAKAAGLSCSGNQ